MTPSPTTTRLPTVGRLMRRCARHAETVYPGRSRGKGAVGSGRVRVAPQTPPLVVPAPIADVVARWGADAEWSAVLHDLDTTWEQDWPRTIAVLEHFLDRWAGYGPAEDKLYAALVADAEGQLQAEQVAAAAAELEQAARLLPERGEAWTRLAQLATAAPSEYP